MHDLIKIARQWLNPAYALRLQAIKTSIEFGLSQQSFENTLNWIFECWTDENIARGIQKKQALFLEQDLSGTIIQILAGNTPAVIAQGFFQGTLLNQSQILKIPTNQTTFAKLLYQSFCEISPEIAQLFTLETSKEALLPYLPKASLVIAYGDDKTMKILDTHLSCQAKFMAHGHTQSVVVIFKDADIKDADTHQSLTSNQDTHKIHQMLVKLADDMLSYDGRGCLSPRIVFVEEGGAFSPEIYAKIFAEDILPNALKKWPQGKFLMGEMEEILHQRIVYGFLGKVYQSVDWTVCYHENSRLPTHDLPRFLPFQPFASKEALLALLNTMPLMQIGYSGDNMDVLKSLECLNVPMCAIGQMQKQLLLF